MRDAFGVDREISKAAPFVKGPWSKKIEVATAYSAKQTHKGVAAGKPSSAVKRAGTLKQIDLGSPGKAARFVHIAPMTEKRFFKTQGRLKGMTATMHQDGLIRKSVPKYAVHRVTGKLMRVESEGKKLVWVSEAGGGSGGYLVKRKQLKFGQGGRSGVQKNWKNPAKLVALKNVASAGTKGPGKQPKPFREYAQHKLDAKDVRTAQQPTSNWMKHQQPRSGVQDGHWSAWSAKRSLGNTTSGKDAFSVRGRLQAKQNKLEPEKRQAQRNQSRYASMRADRINLLASSKSGYHKSKSENLVVPERRGFHKGPEIKKAFALKSTTEVGRLVTSSQVKAFQAGARAAGKKPAPNKTLPRAAYQKGVGRMTQIGAPKKGVLTAYDRTDTKRVIHREQFRKN